MAKNFQNPIFLGLVSGILLTSSLTSPAMSMDSEHVESEKNNYSTIEKFIDAIGPSAQEFIAKENDQGHDTIIVEKESGQTLAEANTQKFLEEKFNELKTTYGVLPPILSQRTSDIASEWGSKYWASVFATNSNQMPNTTNPFDKIPNDLKAKILSHTDKKTALSTSASVAKDWKATSDLFEEKKSKPKTSQQPEPHHEEPKRMGDYFEQLENLLGDVGYLKKYGENHPEKSSSLLRRAQALKQSFQQFLASEEIDYSHANDRGPGLAMHDLNNAIAELGGSYELSPLEQQLQEYYSTIDFMTSNLSVYEEEENLPTLFAAALKTHKEFEDFINSHHESLNMRDNSILRALNKLEKLMGQIEKMGVTPAQNTPVSPSSGYSSSPLEDLQMHYVTITQIFEDSKKGANSEEILSRSIEEKEAFTHFLNTTTLDLSNPLLGDYQTTLRHLNDLIFSLQIQGSPEHTVPSQEESSSHDVPVDINSAIEKHYSAIGDVYNVTTLNTPTHLQQVMAVREAFAKFVEDSNIYVAHPEYADDVDATLEELGAFILELEAKL